MAHEDVVSQEEARALITNFMESRGAEGATEEELESVVSWARNIKLGTALLELVLAGEVRITGLRDGEPLFYRTST
jgi:hypothetical protein